MDYSKPAPTIPGLLKLDREAPLMKLTEPSCGNSAPCKFHLIVLYSSLYYSAINSIMALNTLR